MKRIFILSLLLPLLFIGCGKKTNTETEMEVELQGISLNKKSVELEIGQTVNLIVVYNPEDAEKFAPEVTWESSSPSVAIVENGKVTAKQKGKATITAYCGKFYADCQVEVLTGGDNVIDWNAPYMYISPNVINDNSYGGEYEVKVMSNQSWSATCGESWLSVSPSSGEGDATVKITVAERKTEAADEGVVTFTAGEITKKVTVKRAERYIGAPLPNVSQISVPIEGKTFTVGVYHSSSEWSASCSDPNVTFSDKTDNSITVTVAPNMGEKSQYVVDTWYLNTEPSDKTITVTFKNKDGLSNKMTIVQPNPYASMQLVSRGAYWKDGNKTPLYVNEVVEEISPSYGNKYDLNIHSNIPWKIEFTYDMGSDGYGHKYIQDYLTASPSSGQNNRTVLITLVNMHTSYYGYNPTGKGSLELVGTGKWEGCRCNRTIKTSYNQDFVDQHGYE